jgi:glycerate 2-kinase
VNNRAATATVPTTGTMHVLVAPDKFKGSLTAVEVAAHVTSGLAAAAPEIPVVQVPVADGGDGTLEATLSAGYRKVPVRVAGPVGNPVASSYAVRGDVAVVELADACGLNRLPAGRLAPLDASSTGLGQVLRAVFDAGIRRVVIGVGGSASTDGGAGMLAALGVGFFDANGTPLTSGGGALGDLAHIDLSGLHPAAADLDVLLASDVDNPLLGPRGAAAVYGPQKGATRQQVGILEAGLARLSAVLGAATGVAAGPHGHPAADVPGAGAAGGVGFAALAVLDATARPGIELLLELIGFYDQLPGSRLVVTGEGSLDEQTLHGKAPAGVARAARRAGVPAVAVAGRTLLSARRLATAGIQRSYALTDIEPDPTRCIAQAGPLLERLAGLVALDWLTGPPGTQPIKQRSP